MSNVAPDKKGKQSSLVGCTENRNMQPRDYSRSPEDLNAQHGTSSVGVFYCMNHEEGTDDRGKKSPLIGILPKLSDALQMEFPDMKEPSRKGFIVPQECSKVDELQYGKTPGEEELYRCLLQTPDFVVLSEILNLFTTGVIWRLDCNFVTLNGVRYKDAPTDLAKACK